MLLRNMHVLTELVTQICFLEIVLFWCSSALHLSEWHKIYLCIHSCLLYKLKFWFFQHVWNLGCLIHKFRKRTSWSQVQDDMDAKYFLFSLKDLTFSQIVHDEHLVIFKLFLGSVTLYSLLLSLQQRFILSKWKSEKFYAILY